MHLPGLSHVSRHVSSSGRSLPASRNAVSACCERRMPVINVARPIDQIGGVQRLGTNNPVGMLGPRLDDGQLDPLRRQARMLQQDAETVAEQLGVGLNLDDPAASALVVDNLDRPDTRIPGNEITGAAGFHRRVDRGQRKLVLDPVSPILADQRTAIVRRHLGGVDHLLVDDDLERFRLLNRSDQLDGLGPVEQ